VNARSGNNSTRVSRSNFWFSFALLMVARRRLFRSQSGTHAVVRLNTLHPSIILSCASAINFVVLVYIVRIKYSTPSRTEGGQPWAVMHLLMTYPI